MSKHVAVLMGGWSAEREVSLRSARPGDLLCYGDHIAVALEGGEIVRRRRHVSIQACD